MYGGPTNPLSSGLGMTAVNNYSLPCNCTRGALMRVKGKGYYCSFCGRSQSVVFQRYVGSMSPPQPLNPTMVGVSFTTTTTTPPLTEYVQFNTTSVDSTATAEVYSSYTIRIEPEEAQEDTTNA